MKKYLIKIGMIIGMIFMFFCVSPSISQQINTDVINSNKIIEKPLTVSKDKISNSISLISNLEFVLSVSVLFFGVFVLCIEYKLLSNRSMPEDTFKIIVITIIVIGSMFLITAGYSNDQIAPVSGLFGTISGYLIGKISSRNSDDK